MISLDTNEESRLATLTLNGEVLLEQAEELRTALSSVLNRFDEVIIDLHGLDRISLSTLQLFCSAHRTAISRHKRLRLMAGCSKVFLKTAAEAGYARHTGCSLDRDENCLWMKKEVS